MSITGKVFDGLYGFEVIMLTLGAMLFLVILVLLVLYAVQKRQLKGLLPFFGIPVMMIGYPSIKIIKIGEWLEIVKNYPEETGANPDNSQPGEEVKEALAKLDERPISNPATLVTIAETQAVVGDTAKALETVQNALEANPDYKPAVNLNKEIRTQIQIDKNMTRLHQNPGDAAARRELSQQIKTMETVGNLSSTQLLKVARASATLGDTTKAVIYADSALKRTTVFPKAAEFKRQIIR